jgi:putative transposase
MPNIYRHLRELQVRYASWDLTHVYLVDEREGKVLCLLYPQDKTRNANAVRRPLEPLGSSPPISSPQATRAAGVAPLLESLMAQQRASGLPPAYLPQEEEPIPRDLKNTGADA